MNVTHCPVYETLTGGIVVKTQEGNFFFESRGVTPTFIVTGRTVEGNFRASFLSRLPKERWAGENIYWVDLP